MASHAHTHERITVTGIVQGVGFRPFIYGLATARGLAGYVTNTPDGVIIDIAGTHATVDSFADAITTEAPPLAQIVSVTRETLDGDESEFGNSFVIRESSRDGTPRTLIAPDAATCPDCLRELFDPGDRRHLYPFINCTNCGPRFTIIRGLPYDRPYTTMASFTMCPDCDSEYHDPVDRRFHAQPNACAVCGPHLSLLDAGGAPISGDPVVEAIRMLNDGRILAVKGLGGFHLVVDATNESAVRQLRERKHREEKPFALMTGSLDDARRLVRLSPAEEQVLTGRERPIVLAPRRDDAPAAPSVAPGNGFLGVMLPYTPLHFMLFYHPHAGGSLRDSHAIFPALVMTSGNLSEEPICRDNDEAIDRLGDIADAFLVHNRDIHVRGDDSVVTAVTGEVSFIRRSRGYAPMPVFLPAEGPSVLALGPELKNTICVTEGRRAFLSQHIGDLENIATYSFYQEAVDHFKAILDLDPRIIAHDLHPNYRSTRYFNEYAESHNPDSFGGIGIQHHHAHIAGVLAEHGRDDTVIGLALDGTGYGTDGTIWGGEILIASPAAFVRAAHILAVPMPGGERAVREHWRMAFAWLRAAFGDSWRDWRDHLPALSQLPPESLDALDLACTRGVNAPLTSSLGRQFDAVASLLDIRQKSTFEGQGAIELDLLADTIPEGTALPYDITENGTPACEFPVLSGTLVGLELPAIPAPDTSHLLDYRPTIRAIAEQVRGGADTAQLARDFHETLMASLHDIVRHIREKTEIATVVLSGGCWQNRILSAMLPERLAADGFEVLINRLVPVNDGGVALGQAYVAQSVANRNIPSP